MPRIRAFSVPLICASKRPVTRPLTGPSNSLATGRPSIVPLKRPLALPSKDPLTNHRAWPLTRPKNCPDSTPMKSWLTVALTLTMKPFGIFVGRGARVVDGAGRWPATRAKQNRPICRWRQLFDLSLRKWRRNVCPLIDLPRMIFSSRLVSCLRAGVCVCVTCLLDGRDECEGVGPPSQSHGEYFPGDN